MLLSMTGYGRAVNSFKDKTITVEIRSLNSKFTDLRFKVPQQYREKEHEMRKLIIDRAERGKIDVSIDLKSPEGDDEFTLNETLFNKYYSRLSKLATRLEMPQGDLMQAILKLPNVISADAEGLGDEEWAVVKKTIVECLDAFIKFRTDEGKAMESDSTDRINSITSLLEEIAPHEKARVELLRNKISKNMTEYVGKDNIDANRFEQEILYYLEKIDITEEKVRLSQHCKYFLKELATSKTLKGKKLSFISQEIGREINTLGSKANSSDIQHIVVKMKDELEKIKEQVANTV